MSPSPVLVVECKGCGGSGSIASGWPDGSGGYGRHEICACEACGGTGDSRLRCVDCGDDADVIDIDSAARCRGCVDGMAKGCCDEGEAA